MNGIMNGNHCIISVVLASDWCYVPGCNLLGVISYFAFLFYLL